MFQIRIALDAQSLPLSPAGGENAVLTGRYVMKRKILIGIPERLLDQIDLLADYRSQTRSELIREALRTHLERAQSIGAPVTTPPLSLIAGQRKDETALVAAIN